MASGFSLIRPTRSVLRSPAPADSWKLKICGFTIFGMRGFRGYSKPEGLFHKQRLFLGIEVGQASNAILIFDKQATSTPIGDGRASPAYKRPEDLAEFDKRAKKAGAIASDESWLRESGTQGVLARMQPHIARLKQKKADEAKS